MFGQINYSSKMPPKPMNNPFSELQIDRLSKRSGLSRTQGNQEQPQRVTFGSNNNQIDRIELTQSKKDMLQQFKNKVTLYDSNFDHNQFVQTQEGQQSTQKVQQSKIKSIQQYKNKSKKSQKKQINQNKQVRQSLCFSISQHGSQNQDKINQRKTNFHNKNNQKTHQSNKTVKQYLTRMSEPQITFELKQNISKEKLSNLKKILQDMGFLQIQTTIQDISQSKVQRILSQRYDQIRSSNKLDQILKIICSPQQNLDDQEQQQPCQVIRKHSKKGIIKKTSFTEKKVSLVVPQGLQTFVNLKQSWIKQLQSSIQLLTSHLILKKYCYHKQKIQEVQVTFSYDFKFMIMKKTNKSLNSVAQSFKSLCLLNTLKNGISKENIISLSDLGGILSGRKSKNFQKYIKNHVKVNDQQAFSLVFKYRTIDLLCQSQDQRKNITKAIKIVLEFLLNK